MDPLPKELRSRNMSRVRSENTKPEKIVRSLLFRQGYRFRLHRKDLPGTPDIVLPKFRVVIFIHGASGIITHARTARPENPARMVGSEAGREQETRRNPITRA
jgi:DNA mismatch endonuclease Vsr